ncbi:ABC-type sugar transport system permease subunit [Celerinatantimonas diazotrophica]|uniref:ABC-type sugar transport system permease subunit n=2 Tax=Celerinatantimonas diazotrophica TaxID=412034 RepID=A0A4R1JLY0_9GAMM|nr:ABC-type sugar transport system permease subunit [Celerinatantimonas diazotrophica]CAG9296244.1 hypothetical protein CEDIAZO_01392 [Celerinatantimonas diazotrophica]
MISPACGLIGLFFIYPLISSLKIALSDAAGNWSINPLIKAWRLYDRDLAYTIIVVAVALGLIAILTVVISGLITLSPFKRLNQCLAFLYRWPLFIPFIVVGQMMRTFLAKNGLMNNALVQLHLLTPFETVSFLDWRGIIFTFVWKQLAFSTLLVAGAMAAIDSQQVKAAQNIGATRMKVFTSILLPQVLPNLGVALVLSCVTMMSVLSVPLMLGTGTPSMLTTDMSFRINSYGDYATANALGVFSYLVTSAVAWFYLQHNLKQQRTYG